MSFAFVVNVCRFKCVCVYASISLHLCTITVKHHGFAVNMRYKIREMSANATVVCVCENVQIRCCMLCSTLLIVSTQTYFLLTAGQKWINNLFFVS